MRPTLLLAIGASSALAFDAMASSARAQTSIADGQYMLGVAFVATPPAGDVLLQELTSAYSFTAAPDPKTHISESITGNLSSAVFSSNGGATRDFFYQFTVTSGTAAVTTLSICNFDGYGAAIGQSRPTDIDGTGNTYGSPFSKGGFSSASAMVATNATMLAPTGTAAPEPASLLRAVPGGLGLIGLTRFRRVSKS